MQEIRYKEICDHLDPCIESLLNIIRRYLQANQASVMVGAGFSKNAIFAPGVMMKDWNGLGKDFYEQLYAKSPQPKDLEFKSPVRCASPLASYTSHIELDKIISNSLPDLSVEPYVKYGVGVRKSWGERLTGFFQTYLTNGGRNGVGLQAGFTWAFGGNKNKSSAKKAADQKNQKSYGIPELKKTEIVLGGRKIQ